MTGVVRSRNQHRLGQAPGLLNEARARAANPTGTTDIFVMFRLLYPPFRRCSGSLTARSEAATISDGRPARTMVVCVLGSNKVSHPAVFLLLFSLTAGRDFQPRRGNSRTGFFSTASRPNTTLEIGDGLEVGSSRSILAYAPAAGPASRRPWPARPRPNHRHGGEGWRRCSAELIGAAAGM